MELGGSDSFHRNAHLFEMHKHPRFCVLVKREQRVWVELRDGFPVMVLLKRRAIKLQRISPPTMNIGAMYMDVGTPAVVWMRSPQCMRSTAV